MQEVIDKLNGKIRLTMTLFQYYWRLMDYDKGDKISDILTFLKKSEHAYIIRKHELKKLQKDYAK